MQEFAETVCSSGASSSGEGRRPDGQRKFNGQTGHWEEPITVIVPVFNGEEHLSQCLTSIRCQDYENLQILCINDGSTDDSLRLMNEQAAVDGRIAVINKPNEGYGASCNRGLALVEGAWVAIVECDDWLEPGAFTAMTAFADRFNVAPDMIKTPYWRILEADTPQEHRALCRFAGRVRPPRQPFTVDEAPELMRTHPSIWSALYRTDFLRREGIRFNEYPGAGWADNPFLAETLCRARRIVYLNRAFYCYREEDEAKTRSFYRRNPLMPLDRWLSMGATMIDAGITDEDRYDRLWQAHYRRAFAYLESIAAFGGLAPSALAEAQHAVFSCMDPRLVFQEDAISPSWKRTFADFRGLDAPQGMETSHAAYMAREALWTLRQGGPKTAAATAKRIFTRHRS